MQHNLRDFLRHGGHGQYVVSQRNDSIRQAISIKSLFPGYAGLRSAFSDRLDQVIADNTRALLNALTPADTAPWVTEADLRDVSDAKEAVLREWDMRLTAIFEEYQSHPQRLRPLRTAMEERLLRAFAGLINQLRQQDLGIERYIWRSRDDAQVRDSHAEYDDQVFSWDEPPAGGHPGQAHNCRCFAEPVASLLPNDAVLAQYAPAAEIPVGAFFRGLVGRAVALTPQGAAALAAFLAAWEASNALGELTELATERRLNRAADILGVDLGSGEGLLAAIAHELVQETVSTGFGSSLPKTVDAARIAGQAAALFEMSNPGTIQQVAEGDRAAQRALGAFVQRAYDAFSEGRLRLQDGTIADGWVEVFPELTEDERRLGELPGFTPERIEQWLEIYPAEVLGLPNHTGSPAAEDPTGNIISTPIPELAGPSILEARPANITTPDGNIVRGHGPKGDGAEYITGKGHTAEQIDGIIANPNPDLSGVIRGFGPFKGQEMTLLTGRDGHWVILNPDGEVVAVSNRNVPLRAPENDLQEIIRPLE